MRRRFGNPQPLFAEGAALREHPEPAWHPAELARETTAGRAGCPKRS